MAPAEVWVNGQKLGEMTVSNSGRLDFRLDTQLANPGWYTVVVKTPQKIVMGHFILDPLAEQHTGGDELVTFSIPAGIEMDQIVYLPLVRR